VTTPTTPPHDVYPHLKDLVESFAVTWRRRGLHVGVYDVGRRYNVLLGDDRASATVTHDPQSPHPMLIHVTVGEHGMAMRPDIKCDADVGFALAMTIALLDYQGAGWLAPTIHAEDAE
jgi:hypothetical protein